MGIPYRFDPMGTLGADYVKNGLLLLFDATREPVGTLNSLTNFATGDAVALGNSVENNGGYLVNNKQRLGVSLGSVMEGAKAFEFVCGYANSAGPIGVSAFNNSLQVYYFPEVSAFTPSKNYLRVDKRRSLCRIIGTDDVWGIYFTETETSVYNGELGPAAGGSGAGIYGDFVLGTNIPFFGIRVYNHELTPAEKAQNWAIDKKKFSL